MRVHFVSRVLLGTVFLLWGAHNVCGQSLWSGVIDPSRAINWSSVGANISTTRTQCTTSACQTVSSGTTVTAASTQAALSSAPQNSYVLLPAGTFTMNANLWVPSYVTLRGAGSNSTLLNFTASSGNGPAGCGGHVLCASSTDVNYAGGPSNTASWTGTNGVTGTYTQGATSIILSSVTNLAVGSPIVLDQVDDQHDNGGLYIGCEIGTGYSGNPPGDDSPACATFAHTNGFERGTGSLSTIRGQQQIVNVTSISGSGPYTVGITPGIYAPNWRSSQSPGAWWATSPTFAAGFEDFYYNMTNSGGTGIDMFNCTGCWVKGVAAVTESSGGTGWHSVGFDICNHCTVRDSYHYGYTGDDYGFAVYIGSDILIENNIGQYPGEGMFNNSDCEGCVATYNFSVGTLYTSSSNWLEQPNDFHGIQLYALYEGNIDAGLYADAIHGSHGLNTYFRNRWDGREQNGSNATSNNTTALLLASGARYNNVIGNVFGTPGYHTNYKAPYNASQNLLSVSTISTGAYPGSGTQDPLVNTTSMFWGNWDSVDNTVRWCGNASNPGWSTTCGSVSEVPSNLTLVTYQTFANSVPSTTTLPASLVYSSKPSWWPSSKSWPSIGPDVTAGNVGQCSGGTYDSMEAESSVSSQCSDGGGSFSVVAGGMVVSNPAMDCYLNTMGGNLNGTGGPMAFDSTACYGAGGSGGGSSPTPSAPPAPPTGLTAVVN